jgi:molecular chaperone DnaK
MSFVGIDLGTSHFRVAVLEGSRPELVENAEQLLATPSIVAFSDSGERLVGMPAKRHALTNPTDAITSLTRLFDRPYNDVNIDTFSKHVSYKIVPSEDGSAWPSVRGTAYAPTQIAAALFDEAKKRAELYLGEAIHNAVVVAPTHFAHGQSYGQGRLLIEAANQVGLSVVRLVSAPNAAAMLYAHNVESHGTVAIFDMGAATFNFSVVGTGDRIVDVKSVAGNLFLGGDDFDFRVIDHIAKQLNGNDRIEMASAIQGGARLKDKVEKARIDLSRETATSIEVGSTDTNSEGFSVPLTRSTLEGLVDDLIQEALVHCEQGLKDAGMAVRDIDAVLLIGGMTGMPRIHEAVQQFFNKEPIRGAHADKQAAMGAALFARMLQGSSRASKKRRTKRE